MVHASSIVTRHDLSKGDSMGHGRVFPSQRADVTIRIEVVVNTDPDNVAEGTRSTP